MALALFSAQNITVEKFIRARENGRMKASSPLRLTEAGLFFRYFVHNLATGEPFQEFPVTCFNRTQPAVQFPSLTDFGSVRLPITNGREEPSISSRWNAAVRLFNPIFAVEAVSTMASSRRKEWEMAEDINTGWHWSYSLSLTLAYTTWVINSWSPLHADGVSCVYIPWPPGKDRNSTETFNISWAPLGLVQLSRIRS